jgi:hypothetical protein
MRGLVMAAASLAAITESQAAAPGLHGRHSEQVYPQIQKAAIQRAPKALSAPAGGATRSPETGVIRGMGGKGRW